LWDICNLLNEYLNTLRNNHECVCYVITTNLRWIGYTETYCSGDMENSVTTAYALKHMLESGYRCQVIYHL